MNIPAASSALVLSALLFVVAPSASSFAQPKDGGAAAAESAPAGAKQTAPNTNTNPWKHRYWRHRGGNHPHFGSRRVRT